MSSPDLDSGLVQISKISKSGLVQISKIRKSGLVQICQNKEIWTCSKIVFSTPAGPDSQKVKSGLVQISKIRKSGLVQICQNKEIWTSPDFNSGIPFYPGITQLEHLYPA